MAARSKKTETNHIAFDLYAKGLHTCLTPTEENVERARNYFDLSTRQDPNFSLGYSASAYMDVLAGGLYVPFKEVAGRAKDLNDRALRLDPNSAEAHMVQGNIFLQVDLDWKKAETEFQKSIALCPGYVLGHFWYAVLESTLQRYGEASEHCREIIRWNPRNNLGWMGLVQTCYMAGDLSRATTLSEQSRDWEPTSFDWHLMTGYCYAASGRISDARAEAERSTIPPSPGGRVERSILNAILGQHTEAEQLLKELDLRSKAAFVPPVWLASLHSVIGETDRAMDILESDFREGERALWVTYLGPQFDHLWDNPRFPTLLRKYNLPSMRTGRLAMPSALTMAPPIVAMPERGVVNPGI